MDDVVAMLFALLLMHLINHDFCFSSFISLIESFMGLLQLKQKLINYLSRSLLNENILF